MTIRICDVLTMLANVTRKYPNAHLLYQLLLIVRVLLI